MGSLKSTTKGDNKTTAFVKVLMKYTIPCYNF